MPRVARIVIPGIPHHVTQRGNRRGTVFFGDPDRHAYLSLLRTYADRQSVEVLAYCLMQNHVHLVVVPRQSDGLHLTLKPLHMQYAQRVNRLHDWHGHLWQGRYFSSPLGDDYFWAAIRYVERNPVRAGLTDRASDYPWSSAAARCRGTADPVLTTCPVWTRQLSAVRNWPEWLETHDEPECLELLRRRADKGLPCGSPDFIAHLERTTGRDFGERARGRQAGKLAAMPAVTATTQATRSWRPAEG
jgi:putative transposase